MATDTHDAAVHDVAHDDAHTEHWTDLKYIQLAAGLAAITAIEVAASYTKDTLGWFFLPLLLGLMAIKFMAVVLYFMHLKFDNRIFSIMFYLGLFLAIAVYIAALCTFQFFGA